MVMTPHAVVGAALTRDLHPAAAFAVGVVSHFALDRIPHEDYTFAGRDAWRLAADALAASAIVATMPGRGSAAGAFGGIFPDIVQVGERHIGTNVTLPFHGWNHTGRGVQTRSLAIGSQALVALAGWAITRRRVIRP